MPRIAVKIGSSVLSSSDESPDYEVLQNIVDEVARLRSDGIEVLIITSGAIMWGRSTCRFDDDFRVDVSCSSARQTRKELVRLQVLSSVGQVQLVAQYADLFERRGIIASQILLTRHDMVEQARYDSLVLVAENLLALGIVPIFNENDVLSTEEIVYSDNDQLAAMLSTALRVDKLVILTNIDGLYTIPPDEPGAELIADIKDLDKLTAIVKDGKSKIGLGHMNTKVEAARLVTTFGVEVIIANGKRKGILHSVLCEGGACTRIHPHGRKLRLKKGWLALGADSKGEVVVSTFLAEALSSGKPASILIIGVEDVTGTFQKGSVVTVKDMEGRKLGRGEVRMSSQDLRDKLEKRRRGEEVEFFGIEVIHFDYFVESPELSSI